MVELAFRKAYADRPDFAFDEIGLDKPKIWHHSIRQRKEHDPAFNLEGKKIIACIRRLPGWLLSRVHFEAERSKLVPTREQFISGKFYEATGYLNNADAMIRNFDNPRVDHWIRVEQMPLDIHSATGFVMAQIPRANENKMSFIKGTGFWFSDAELKHLYDANPQWAALERRVYGTLLCD